MDWTGMKKKRRGQSGLRIMLILASLALIAGKSEANDGGIAFGGSPKLLKSHPSVSMKSETIRMHVGQDVVTVDCRFVFRNNGPATTVRMGFPDEAAGEQAREVGDVDEQGREIWKTTPPRSNFKSFKSYVDGKPVKTTLIRANQPSHFWHAKVVRFPARSTRIVRDVYTVDVGGQITADSYIHQASYILHTGASWNGPIGYSEVIVTFDPKRKQPTLPLRARAVASYASGPPFHLSWKTLPSGTVYYNGPSKPIVKGRTLRFVRSNWHPKPSDNIWLGFKSGTEAG